MTEQQPKDRYPTGPSDRYPTGSAHSGSSSSGSTSQDKDPKNEEAQLTRSTAPRTTPSAGTPSEVSPAAGAQSETPQAEHNPYATPGAEVRDVHRPQGFQKASRGKRLGATIIDNIILLAIIFAAALASTLLVSTTGETMGDAPGSIESVFVIPIAGSAMLIYFLIQAVLIHQNGWTMGKKMLGIRVVRTDGQDCSLVRYIMLRGILNGALSILPLYGLIDPLMIFGEQSRCVHDYLADTIVIDA